MLRTPEAIKLLKKIGYSTSTDFLAEGIEGIAELQGLGFVDCGTRPGFYVLTEAGKRVLLPVTELRNPTPLNKFVRPVSVSQLSVLELMSRLAADGWKDVSVESKSKHTPPLKSNSDRVWYQHAAASKVSANYLRVLLTSGDIFKTGLMDEIHHFQLETWQSCSIVFSYTNAIMQLYN